jgi:hypothetical protein
LAFQFKIKVIGEGTASLTVATRNWRLWVDPDFSRSGRRREALPS